MKKCILSKDILLAKAGIPYDCEDHGEYVKVFVPEHELLLDPEDVIIRNGSTPTKPWWKFWVK